MQIIQIINEQDAKGGRVAGSIHLPDSEFDVKSVEILLKKIAEKKSNDVNVVFHCMESARRGPRCARRFHDALRVIQEEMSPEDVKKSKIMIYILQGGFDQWIRAFFGTDVFEDHVEDYDDDYWGFEETRKIWDSRFHKNYERPEDQPRTPWSEAGRAVQKKE